MAKKTAPALSDFPDYVAELRTLNSLESQAAKLEAEIERVCAGRSMAKARLEARARALLAGETVAEDPDPAELQDRLDVVKEAIRQQVDKVATKTRESSRTICQRQFPEHKAIVHRIDKAFAELHAAIVAERQFREELELNGVLVVPPIVPMQSPLDLDHYLEHWHSDRKHAGYLD